MKFVMLEPHPAKAEWADQALQEYLKKINPLMDFELQWIKTPKSAREQAHAKKESESQSLLSQIATTDYVVLFDERGKSLSSENFAKLTQEILNSGKKRALWILGGAYGVTAEVQAKAHAKVSLSPLVMNHLVARTVALEQIYRSFCILKNLPYHNI